MIWIGIVLAALVATVGVSYLVEAARSQPTAPSKPSWAPTVPVRYVDVDGVRLRYVTTGEGPALVLLHTLRTQLDMFQKVIPALATRFRVYALDYPGHGYSDIPRATYAAGFFVNTVAAALDRLDVKDAVVVGESIGGSIALLLAARRNPRVRRVVAINPYDYDGGRFSRAGCTVRRPCRRRWPARCTWSATGGATIGRSHRWSATGRVGKPRVRNTRASTGRRSSSTGTTTGRMRTSGSPMPERFPTPRSG